MAGGAKRWNLSSPAAPHSFPQDLPPAMVPVLLGRGIDDAEKLRLFLEPPQRLPYDPLRLAGMDLAVQRLCRAIKGNERVGVFGDFDVDGVTGTAIVAEGLEPLGAQVIPYLPHRTEEGHGLSEAAIDHLAAQGVTLIVTVDCGVTSVAEVAYAQELGIDVIITDHHIPQTSLPAAAAIINTQLPGSKYPFLALCGAGLAFKLVQGAYQFFGQPWPDALLELAALGTIADLVSMVDENRYLVQQGLVALSQTQRPGLQALYRYAGVGASPLTTETVAFQVTPRLNSAGRMGHALDSYRLLTTRSAIEAEALAGKLEEMNQDRRQLTEEAMDSAREQVQGQLDSGPLPAFLMVSGGSITRGVAGLVAGRLAEMFHRPAVALSLEEGYAVGSGRSIPGFDIFEAFTGCEDLFVRFGGHAQAAGFTVRRESLPVLQRRLTATAEEKMSDSDDLSPSLEIDAEIRLADLGGGLSRWVSLLEPFGPANPRPVFLTRRVQVSETHLMGKTGQHLRLKVREGDSVWTALAFGQAERWVPGTTSVDLAYSLTNDHRNGPHALNLRVLDFQPATA